MKLDLFIGVQFSKGLGSFSSAIYQQHELLAESRSGIRCSSIQHAELEAIVDGITSAIGLGATKIIIHGCSTYFRTAFSKWARYWSHHMWQNAEGRSVEHAMLWGKILEHHTRINVSTRRFNHRGFQHVMNYTRAIRHEQDNSKAVVALNKRVIKQPKQTIKKGVAA